MFRGQLGLTLAEGGRIWDPCEIPSPRARVWLARKEELTVTDCVWTLCFRRALEEVCGRSRARTERQRSTVLTTAPILSPCKSPVGPKPVDLLPRSLLLDVTEQLVAAAGSRPPCPRVAVLWRGSQSCGSGNGSPGCPAVPWSRRLGLCVLQLVSHLLRLSKPRFSDPFPSSPLGLLSPGVSLWPCRPLAALPVPPAPRVGARRHCWALPGDDGWEDKRRLSLGCLL